MKADVPLVRLRRRNDRKLGHRWDNWDQKPLPKNGDYSTHPALFLICSFILFFVLLSVATGLLWLLLQQANSVIEANTPAQPLVWWVIIAATVYLIWLLCIFTSYQFRRNLLPPCLAERSLFLFIMHATYTFAKIIHLHDKIGNSSVQIYNQLVRNRKQNVYAKNMLLLVPRCLCSAKINQIMDLSARYQVPLYVADRGRHAKQVVMERKPHLVIAVACERDAVAGLVAVAKHVPTVVFLLTMPHGPCKNTELKTNEVAAFIQHSLAV